MPDVQNFKFYATKWQKYWTSGIFCRVRDFLATCQNVRKPREIPDVQHFLAVKRQKYWTSSIFVKSGFFLKLAKTPKTQGKRQKMLDVQDFFAKRLILVHNFVQKKQAEKKLPDTRFKVATRFLELPTNISSQKVTGVTTLTNRL